MSNFSSRWQLLPWPHDRLVWSPPGAAKSRDGRDVFTLVLARTLAFLDGLLLGELFPSRGKRAGAAPKGRSRVWKLNVGDDRYPPENDHRSISDYPHLLVNRKLFI